MHTDVVVAHAPHFWDTEQETAEEAHRKFWQHFTRLLTRRKSDAPIIMLMDANLEVAPSEAALISDHQCSTPLSPSSTWKRVSKG